MSLDFRVESSKVRLLGFLGWDVSCVHWKDMNFALEGHELWGCMGEMLWIE